MNKSKTSRLIATSKNSCAVSIAIVDVYFEFKRKIFIITHVSRWYRKTSVQHISRKINKHELCLISSAAFKSRQETTTFTFTELRTVMDPTAGNVCNI
jgi:hypothetical protein